MSTTVVNVKSGQPWDVYIGRASFRARDPRCHTGSEWANPFKMRAVGQVGLFPSRGGSASGAGQLHPNVESALAAYERRLRGILAADPGARARLLALKGKRLGCWCRPDPCHGDVLVKLIEELER